MVLSMAVIGVFAAIIYLFIPHDASQSPVRTVGYRVELDTARRAAPYPVAAPVGLPKGWRATSVRYDANSGNGAVWHLGFLNPADEYVAVEQSDGRPSAFIRSASQGAERTGGTQRVGDVRWERYQGATYDALVLEERGVTTVVTGTASFGQLGVMAAALETS
jgi:hypothetical protein